MGETGRKMATIRDVARKAGVGTGTISRFFNDPKNVSIETQRKIEEAISVLGYRPNQTARNLSMGRTMTLGLLIPDITNPFFPQVTRGLSDAARATGYEVLLANTDGDPKQEQALLATLASRTDGVVLVPTATEAPAVRPSVPLVLVDRGWHGHMADRVTSENREIMFELASSILKLGHRTIVFLGGPQGIDTAEERRKGLLDALKGHDRVVVHWTDGPFQVESGYERARSLLARDISFTAVMAANDMLAAGALKALVEASIRVPEQVALTGFDNLPWSVLLTPSLTTVDQSAYILGQAAAELLIGRIRGSEEPPVTRCLPARIVWRESALSTLPYASPIS